MADAATEIPRMVMKRVPRTEHVLAEESYVIGIQPVGEGLTSPVSVVVKVTSDVDCDVPLPLGEGIAEVVRQAWRGQTRDG